MDKLSSEIMKRIKSAVKAKLLEIGMDVDDELPDYILVMIANRRSQVQMENDLSLFLGNHTKSFTEWLHQVVQRLDSVESLDKQQKSSQNLLKTSSLSKDVSSNSGQAAKDQEEYVPMPVSAIHQPAVNKNPAENEEHEDDVLNVDIEEAANNGEPEIQQTLPPNKGNQHVKQKRRSADENQRSSKRQRQEVPHSNSDNRPVSSVVRPVRRDKLRNGRREENERKNEEEESKGTKGGVPSIVHVTARPRRPAKLQANKKLILKAVADAQKSVVSSARPPELKTEKMEPVKELFTRKYLERNNDTRPERIAVTFPNIKEPVVLVEKEEADEIVDNEDMKMDETEIVSEPQFIVTLDGIDENEILSENEKEDEDEYSFPNVRVAARQRIVDLRPAEPKSKLVRRHSTGSDITSKQTTEKCKFWPGCRLGDQCFYYHPKTTCKLLPNCTFGDKCLFVHPKCKFGISCTKKQCPYTHPNERPQLTTPVGPTTANVSNGKVPCKFFPACHNVQCPFFHPAPCKFGTSCTRPGCSFYHPSKFPQKDKLKWQAIA